MAELDSWFDNIEADLAAKAADEQDFRLHLRRRRRRHHCRYASHVLPEFEGLYTRKVWENAPQTQEEPKGLVYHDRFGAIRAVCFYPSEEYAQHYDCVSAFLVILLSS
jgi:hypothetical protein